MELNKVTKVQVTRLRLDHKNPRLLEQSESTNDSAIIGRLFRGAELDELLQSISTNGYLDIEPLVVTGDANDLVVLEGNRRLAALRLLREPDLANQISRAEGIKIRVPEVDESVRSTMEEISVYYVGNREDARSFLGFKHINGPAKWDAYAKARFAAEWYDASQGTSLSEIARSIGDRHDTIKRMVSAIFVLDQAQQNNLFSVEDRHTLRFSFSHLYTALGRSQFMAYLGLESSWIRFDPTPEPVPDHKLGELKQLLRWIYGSKSADVMPVVKAQNPDIRRLGEVLANSEALTLLKSTHDLDKAHTATESVDSRFTSSLIRARDSVTDAAGSIRAYDGRNESLLGIAEDVKETSAAVHGAMLKKKREALVLG